MSDFATRFGTLTPERQALLQRLLKQQSKPSAPAPFIPRRAEALSPALSFAQERMWFLAQLEAGSAFYNIAKAIRLDGRLNVAALEQCLNEIVRRHEALRTTFPTLEGEPVQRIAPVARLPLPVIELSGLPAAARAQVTERLAQAETQRPFDLARGPLLRARLLRLAADEHLLLLSLHHIIADGWSMAVLVQEVGALYGAFNSGRPSAMQELPLQYADFAEWQRAWLAGGALAKQLAYWTEQLQAAPAGVDLLTDRARPAAGTFHGARQHFSLPRETSAALKRASQQAGVSLFMILLAGFQALLYRESGQTDIVVGTRIANRTRREIESLIGFFVNALVLRTNVGGNPTFRQLLARTQQTALGAFENQDVPFELLVKSLQPKRLLNRTPLFNVMFVLQNTPLTTLKVPGLNIKPLEVESTTAKYDLDLTLWDGADGIAGWLEYNTDLFDAATISRLIVRFQHLLASVALDPEQHIEALPLLPEHEQHQVLVEYNATVADYPRAQLVPQLFEAQAARTPDAVAVVCADEQLSYAELNRRANQLARHLRAHGVGPEVPVGVLLPRSSALLVALVGIMKAGGVYVPLDAAYPATHLHKILTETRAPVVLTEATLAAELPVHTAKLIRLDQEWPLIAEHDATNLPVVTLPRNLAYIMYTSGSTGEPKGVAVEHEQLLNRLWWMWRSYPFARDEVLCQRTTSNFSVSLWELLGALLLGRRTAIMPDEVVKDAQLLIKELARLEVTRIVVVPSLLRLLLEVVTDLGRRVPHLKLWSVCGEPLPVELYERFRAQLPAATLLNQYGASEMNDVCSYELKGEHAESARSEFAQVQGAGPQRRFISVGRPIDNVRVYLLDWEMRPVGLGQRGEVFVQSVSPARGYVARPALTAEKFVPDNLSGTHGGRLYRMGDLARYLPDGRIEHLGRADHVVKIRGLRVELKGIEAVLRAHPKIAEAVVEARVAAAGEEPTLVAYIVRAADTELGVSALRHYLREQLVGYMIPAAFVFLAAMPLTPNGKIDRQALPAARAAHAREPEETYLPPQTNTEQTIAHIWQQVLNVERVGLHDNFFDLGGHSLALARVHNRLRETFAKDVALIELFKRPTVSSLAKFFNDQQADESSLQQATDRASKRKLALHRHLRTK